MADAREVGAKFVEAFNAHDEERIRQLNAENATIEAPGDMRVEGREPTTQYAMAASSSAKTPELPDLLRWAAQSRVAYSMRSKGQSESSHALTALQSGVSRSALLARTHELTRASTVSFRDG